MRHQPADEPTRFAIAETSPAQREPAKRQRVDRALGAQQHEADAEQCAAQLRPHAQPRQDLGTPTSPEREARTEDARGWRAGDALGGEEQSDQSAERDGGPDGKILRDGETSAHSRKTREVLIPARGDRRKARGSERHEVQDTRGTDAEDQRRIVHPKIRS